MVAVVSGYSLGLLNTSAGVLGKNGLHGDAANGATNEMAVVNAANGNLVLQTSDDILEGQGLDIASIRTYNSQGSLDEGNGTGWSMSMIKLVGSLTGVVNTAGSTITRTDGDGNQVVYTYNTASGNYVGHEGSGANNTLAYNAGNNTWLFTDGSTNTSETYANLGDGSGNSYISSATDTSGNTLTYGYTGKLLTSVTDSTGESVSYTYNSNGYLAHIDDTLAGGGKSTRVYYNYDTQNRLINVTVDLTPGNSSDNNTYWTNYTYVDSTNQIASVTQQDGSQLNFTYTQVNGQQCVHTATDALGRTTTFTYINSNQTSVSDPTGNVTIYSFDNQGRLTNVASPAVNGVPQTTGYTYDANGDVRTVTDALGNTSTYSYDGNGNLLSQADALGDTASYTYNSINQLTSKTEYTVPATTSGGVTTPASGAETTYYVYDTNKHLAYIISAQGRVTQNIYATGTYSATAGLGAGDLKSTIEYAGDFYPTGTLSVANQPSLGQLNTWVGSANLSQSQRTDYTYDLRGQLTSSTTGGTNTATYVYDQAGNLLNTIDGDANHSTSYTYDGLNRRIGTVDANHNSIVTAYSVNGNSISVTSATGLITLSSYDADGELTSVSQSGSSIASTVASYAYDADGNLLMSTDRLGQHTYYLYDADGRQIAHVDATGQVTQTNYNADNQATSVVQYAKLANTALLINSSTGQPTNPALSSLLFGNTVYSTNWNIYDAAGRLAFAVDAAGDVTRNNYDGAGNLISTTAYATQLNANQLQSLGTGIAEAAFLPLVPNATAQDRTTYYYYDSDNLQTGKLDADGYLTQTTRNGAGQVTQTTGFATSVGQAQIAATTSQTQAVAGTAALNTTATSTTTPQTATAGLNTAPTATTMTTTTAYNATLNTSAPSVTTTQTTSYTAALNNAAVLTSTSQINNGSANLITSALTTSGSGIWQAGSAINASGTALSAPMLATDAAGNMTSAWIQDGHVLTREYSATTQSWGSAAAIDTTGGVQQFNLAVAPDGHTLITWEALSGSTYTVYAAMGTAGSWNAPITVKSSTTFGGLLQGAVSTGGVAAVVFSDSSVSDGISVAQFTGGVSLTGISTPAGSSVPASAVNVGIDGSGNVLVSWINTSGGLRAERYVTGSGWAGMQTLGSTVTALSSVTDAAGAGIIVYTQSGALYAITYNPSTNAFSTPTQISVSPGNALSPNSTFNVAIDANGNAVVGYVAGGSGTVYATVYKGGVWKTPVALGSANSGSNSAIQPQVSINANDDVAVSWQTYSSTTSQWSAQAAYTVGGTWQSAATFVSSANESAAHVAIDGQGNVQTVWLDKISGTATLSSERLNASGTPHYVIPNGATWSSVATALYGTANAATALQNYLGNPALTAGGSLSGMPAVLPYTYTTTVASNPYYVIQSGDTWASITQALYGTNTAAAVAVLQSRYSTVTLAQNNQLQSLQTTLPYSVTTAVSPIYTVQTGDTWTTITQALYGTSDPNAVAALQGLNSTITTLSAGTQVKNLPSPLPYSVTTTTTGAPYYVVKAGDTWTSITQALYGTSDPNAVAALQASNSGTVLTTNGKVSTLPASLTYSVTANYTVPLNTAPTATTTTTTTAYNATLNTSAPSVTTTQTTSYTAALNNAAVLTSTSQINNGSANLITSALTTSGSGIWQAGSAINASGTALSAPMLATDAAGNMTSAWIQDGHVLTREYSATTQSWGSAAAIDTTGGVQQFNLAVAPDGHTLITWEALSGSTYTVYAAMGTAGSWNAPITVKSSTTFGGLLQGAVSTGGVAAVVFSDSSVSDGISVAQFTGGVSLTGISTPAGSSVPASAVNVGIDGSGNVLVSWINTSGGLRAERYVTGSGWAGMQTLGSTVTALSSVTDAAGAGIIVYTQSGALYAITYNPSTNAFSTPTQISVSPGNALSPNSTFNVAIDANGNAVVGYVAGGSGTVYATVYKGGVWKTPVALGSANSGSNSAIQPQVSINANDDVAVSWQTYSSTTSQWSAQAAYTVGGTWQSAATFVSSANESAAHVAIDGQGNVQTVWLDKISGTATLSSERLNASGTPHYVIPNGATWSSVATALYGTANAATALQNYLGNPALTAGGSLSGMPAVLPYTYTTTVASNPYYVIQSGDTWASITQALYGTNTAAAVAVLQSRYSTVTLAQNNQLQSLQTTLPYSVTTAVSPIYTVQTGDTWTTITQALYGTSDPNAVAALQGLNSTITTLTAGTQVKNLPSPLPYSVTTTTTGAPYYVVKAGDTWTSITQALYGTSDPNAVAALQAKNSGTVLTTNGKVSNLPTSLTYASVVMLTVSPYYTVQAGDNWGTIAQLLYGTSAAAAALQQANSTVVLTAGALVENLPSPLSYSYNSTIKVPISLSSVVAGMPSTPDDIVETTAYNSAGQVSATLDGGGYLTQYTYDHAGNLVSKTRFDNPIMSGGKPATGALQYGLNPASINPVANQGQDQTTSYTYTLLNQLQSETDSNGAVTTYSYDADGNVTSVTVSAVNVANDPNARTIDKRYNQLGQLVAELSGNAVALIPANPTQAQIDAVWATQATTHTYDADGQLASTTDPLGNRTLYYYDTDGRLSYTVDAAGEVQGCTYDNEGRLETQTTYAGVISGSTLTTMTGGALAPSQNVFATLATPSLDSTQRYTYNAAGEVTVTTDALGYATTAAYDAFGAVRETLTQTDAAGDLEQQDITYDNRGQATATSTSDNRSQVVANDTVTAVPSAAVTTATNYDAFGRVIQTTDANQKTTYYKYDQLGREVAVTDPSTNQYGTDFTTYDAFNRVVKQTDYLNNTVTTTYNTVVGAANPGNLAPSISVQTAQGITQTITYNVFGQKVRVVDGNGNATNYTYDHDGNLTSVNDAQGNVVSNIYDANDNLLTSTDANNVVTTYSYDAVNRVLTKTNDSTGLSLVTRYAYNSRSQTVQVTDPALTTTVTSYDQKGQVTSVAVDPTGLNLVTYYQYDARGKELQVTDPNGVVTAYQYDTLGRRVSQTVDPTGLDLVTQYAYDGNSNLVTVTDPNNNVTSYVYDADNRVVYSIDGAGDVSYTAYDADGNVSRVTHYANPINRVALGSSPQMGTVAGLISADATRDNTINKIYDKDNRLVYTVDGTGVVTQYAYDSNGNVLKKTSYGTAIPLTTPMDITDVSQAVSALVPSTPNRTTISVYDTRNRVIDQIDGNGALTTFQYDGNGNLIGRTAYAKEGNLATLPANPTAAQVSAWWSASGGASSASDQMSHMVYDGANRLIATATAQGIALPGQQWAVSSITYDRDGNAVSRTSFATTITLQAAPFAATATQAQWQAWMNSVPSVAANDHVTQTVYDNAGRAIFSATAQHLSGGALQYSVVQNSYDKNGNVIATTAYGNFLSSATQSSYASTAAWIQSAAGNPNAALDRMTRNVYDHAGRLSASATAQYLSGSTVQWAVTAYNLDGNGNVLGETSFANVLSGAAIAALAATPANQPQVASWINSVTQNQTQDQATLMSYDAANRVTAVATAQSTAGGITQWAVEGRNYDGNGNVIKKTAYAKTLALAAQSMYGSAGAWSNAVAGNSSPSDRVTQNVFDADNRMIYALDAMNYVTQNKYDALGHVTSTTLYATAVPSNWSAGMAIATAPLDRTSTFSYDAAGNLIGSTDATNASESYAYDGVGNKTSYTNALNNKWTYQYNAAGKLVMETDPLVSVATINGLSASSASAQLSTYNTYDAFGNVTSMTEAYGQPNARMTSYAYDLAGRQTTTISPSVQVYDAGSAAGATASATLLAAASGTTGLSAAQAAGLLTTVSLTSTVTYDALGNAIVNQDVGGTYSNTTYKVYNNAGQVAFDVDALGYVSANTHDAFGNVTALTRYFSPFSMPGNPALGGAETSSAAMQTLLGTQSANVLNRTITTVYDQCGRVIRVIQPQTTIYDNDRSGAMVVNTASQTTETTYDAFGDAILTSVYGAQYAADSTSGTRVTAAQQTYAYFDGRGHMSAQINATSDIADNIPAQGYLTTMTYDAAGNLQTQNQYATKVTGFGLQGTAAVPVAASAPSDRLTTYTYDRDNRKVQQNLNGIVTSYGYDALGNQTSTTDALGGVTYTYYDTLGRVIATATAAATGANIVVDGTPNYNLTVFNLDIYGNVVQQIAYAGGAAFASAPTSANPDNFLPPPTVASADYGDRITYNFYDLDGRKVEGVDAAGNAAFTDYDVFGRAVLQWQNVTTAGYTTTSAADGTIASGSYYFAPTAQGAPAVTPVTETDFSLTTYDAVGQVIKVATPKQGNAIVAAGAAAAPSAVNVQSYVYDAFGEVTSQSMNGTQTQFTSYDNAGHVWLTNSNNGIVDGNLYNVNGQVTEQLTSTSADLAQAGSEAAVAALYQAGDSNLLATGSRYDLQGNVTDHLAAAQLTDANVGNSTLLDMTTPAITSTVNGSTALNPVTDEDNPYSNNKGIEVYGKKYVFTGSNTVTVNLPPQLLGLGGGDVMIQVNYLSQQVAYVAPNLPNPPNVNSTSGYPGLALNTPESYSQIYSADQIPTSGTLQLAWRGDTSAPIGSVASIVVYKKDISGQWQQVINSAPGTAGVEQMGHFVQIQAPQNALAPFSFTYQKTGGGSSTIYLNTPNQPNSPLLYNFDGKILFNTAGMAQGSYSYSVNYQDNGDAVPTLHDSGSFNLAGYVAPPTATAAQSQVAELFIALLNRAPLYGTLVGSTSYANALATGAQSLTQVAQSIASSGEANADFATAGTPNAFVTAVLNNVLGLAASGSSLYQTLLAQYTICSVPPVPTRPPTKELP